MFESCKNAQNLIKCHFSRYSKHRHSHSQRQIMIKLFFVFYLISTYCASSRATSSTSWCARFHVHKTSIQISHIFIRLSLFISFLNHKYDSFSFLIFFSTFVHHSRTTWWNSSTISMQFLSFSSSRKKFLYNVFFVFVSQEIENIHINMFKENVVARCYIFCVIQIIDESFI